MKSTFFPLAFVFTLVGTTAYAFDGEQHFHGDAVRILTEGRVISEQYLGERDNEPWRLLIAYSGKLFSCQVGVTTICQQEGP